MNISKWFLLAYVGGAISVSGATKASNFHQDLQQVFGPSWNSSHVGLSLYPTPIPGRFDQVGWQESPPNTISSRQLTFLSTRTNHVSTIFNSTGSAFVGGLTQSATLRVDKSFEVVQIIDSATNQTVGYASGAFYLTSFRLLSSDKSQHESAFIPYRTFSDPSSALTHQANMAKAAGEGKTVSPIDGTEGDEINPPYLPGRPTPGRDVEALVDEPNNELFQQCYTTLREGMRDAFTQLRNELDACNEPNWGQIIASGFGGGITGGGIGYGIGTFFGLIPAIPSGGASIPLGMIWGVGGGAVLGGAIGAGGAYLLPRIGCDTEAWERYNRKAGELLQNYLECLKSAGVQYMPGMEPALPPDPDA